jgi:bleomycin hydrolase
VPDSVYSGLKAGQTMHNHSSMVRQLQQYLTDALKKRPLPDNWLDGYTKILDENLGVVPAGFRYNGKTYTPQSFAKDVLRFNADDYINITSFTHHPYYKAFVLEAPDNFANGSFYNLPLEMMIDAAKDAVSKGYTVMWDADVSNNGFRQNKGLALYTGNISKDESFTPETKEESWDAAKRQSLYENLTTEDDHLMHIVGTEKSREGKLFFIVKNSWGKVGPYDGYINVSESYFAINTVSLVIPKAALSKELLAKLDIK